MAYIYTWNDAFEAAPADIDDISDGASEIREFKIAVRERLAKDHYFPNNGTDADMGEHNWVTLRKQTGAPAFVADKGFLYTKEVSGVLEMFFENGTGTSTQVTTNGAMASSFAAGTKMLFYQNTAPTGWVIDTTLNDKLVYVTSGSGAGGLAGGIVHATGSWTISGIAANSANVTCPAHTHTVTLNAGTRTHADTEPGQLGTRDVSADPGGVGAYTVNSSSGGSGSGSHTHTCTHTPGWRPAAYNCIICTKS